MASNLEQILRNSERIKAIELDDLIYLERDLDFDEKVSVMFLLCADDHVRSKVLQQQLYVASFTHQEATTFLHSWASEMQKMNSEWRDIFLEAVCIIQAKAIIRKLGLNYIDLEQRFLPRIPNNTHRIHPIVKLLYFVNENLTVAESKELLDRIASDQNFDYRENALLHWLGEDVLNIGRRSTTDRNRNDHPRDGNFCNLDPIMEFLKQNEKDSLKEMVSSACHQFNRTRNVLTDRPSIRTDNKHPIDMGVPSHLSSANSNRSSNVDDAFRIRKANAGIVLIVNQKTFYHDERAALQEFLPTRMLQTRHGTDQDVASLTRTFSTFGYRIIVRENLIHTDILTQVRNVVDGCARKDSLIVCILSHGYKGVVYGANSIPIKIEDIENLMASLRLIGKPKILILQACQGDVTQQAREINFLQHDGPPLTRLPVTSDQLTCISTVPGFTSIRHIEKGSWFIQTLCKKIDELAAHKHFADILTDVGREVQSLRGRDDECMVPIYRSTLRMQLFFPFT